MALHDCAPYCARPVLNMFTAPDCDGHGVGALNASPNCEQVHHFTISQTCPTLCGLAFDPGGIAVVKSMIREWFNAQEAIAAGSALADSFLRDDVRANKGRAKAHGADRRSEVQRLLRRAVLDATPLKLNLFKRAKFLGSFKWRLIDQGFDEVGADELTHLLLLQLSGARTQSAATLPARAPSGGASRKHIDLSLGAADAAARQGDYAEAVVRLQEVLSADPDHAIALSNLGDALCFLGRYPEAEGAYRRAVQADPKRADTHLKLGTVLHWRGDSLGSETTLRRAVKLEPRSANALCGLGHALNALDRADDRPHRRERRAERRLCPESGRAVLPEQPGGAGLPGRPATGVGGRGSSHGRRRRHEPESHPEEVPVRMAVIRRTWRPLAA